MPVEIHKWGIGTNPAIPLVLEGVDFIKSEASDLMYQAQNAIYMIGSSLFDVTTPVISFSPPTVESGTFVRPNAPAGAGSLGDRHHDADGAKPGGRHAG